MWPLRCVFLCLPSLLALGDYHVPEVPGDPGVLSCGLQGFQFTVNLSLEAETPSILTVWDSRGQPHRLQNDSACGTRVTVEPGGSVVLEATYTGCYVTPWGSYYTMTVGVEGAGAAEHEVTADRRLLKCPMELPAPPAPQAKVCDSVPASDRLPCAASWVSRGDCEKLGCCPSSEEDEATSCYYGNTVTSHCAREGLFSIAVSRNVTSPPLRLDSVRLAFGNDSRCEPVVAALSFVLFRFPFTACGTTRRIAGDRAVYENELTATREARTWGQGSITRDSVFRLRVSCSFEVSTNPSPVNVQVLARPPPLPKAESGPLDLELQIAKDENYSSYYAPGDYPVVKFLRDPIHVEVSILHRTDPDLGLLLQQCWATPSPSPLGQPQWPILVKGCPYAGDNYRTQRIPVQRASGLPFPSHHQRFSIFTFSFVRPQQALAGQVHLHCSVSVCQPAGTPACMESCPVSSRRRKSVIYFENRTSEISSKGPMILLQAPEDPSELRKYSGVPVDAPALWVAGVAGAIVIVGTLLLSYSAVRKHR